ncbi:acyltransferase [Aquimarina addita]|uniref:Acyltransferase n=1 Tax=Aquimarina addita TaxID=870485 RepID=A0ABP7XAE1_9FLAO
MIRSLHAFRFIFALMVFMSHLNYIIPSENKFWSFLYRYIFREGYIGVSFFFMLSGYILAYRYTDAIIEKSFSFKTFFSRRLARILPMYYVGLLVALPLSYSELIYGNTLFYIKKMMSTIFMVQSVIPVSDYYFSFNGVSWSISTELFFYIGFPLITAVLIKQRFIKRTLIAVTTLIIILAILLIGYENAYYWLYISPVLRIADFTMGIGLFLLIKGRSFQLSIDEATKWEYRALLVFLLFLILQPYVHANFKLGVYYWIPIGIIISVFSNVQGKITMFLSKPVWEMLGHISFSFYLLHHSYIKYYQHYMMPNIDPKWTGIVILIIILISILTSYVTYRFIEEPARKYIRGRFS